MKDYFRWQDDDLILYCHLLPKSKTDEIVGIHGDRVKIKITAPPVDGKANKYLVHFLAKYFNVPKRSIFIQKGEQGKEKQILIKSPNHLPTQLKLPPKQ